MPLGLSNTSFHLVSFFSLSLSQSSSSIRLTESLCFFVDCLISSFLLFISHRRSFVTTFLPTFFSLAPCLVCLFASFKNIPRLASLPTNRLLFSLNMYNCVCSSPCCTLNLFHISHWKSSSGLAGNEDMIATDKVIFPMKIGQMAHHLSFTYEHSGSSVCVFWD